MGTLITGATGSGKTSGPFQYILRSFLRAGFGGLFLCAKIDAVNEYKKLAESEGRLADVIVFRPGQQSFNFLSYEAMRSGADKAIVENILLMLMQASEIASRKSGRGGDDFFEGAMKQLLRNCLLVVITAIGDVDLGLVLEIVQSLPQSLNDIDEEERLRSMQILAEAESKAAPERKNELKKVRQYFTWEWPTLADRTRSSIAITLSVLLDSFMSYPLREMLHGKTTVSPDDILAGKIVIVDVSVKEFDLIGKIAGVIWKYATQREIERRPGLGEKNTDHLRPVFIAADEAQFWASSSDMLFQTTARSARGLTVYATQNLPNFYAEMGGEGAAKSRVDSLIGNLQNRFACQNLEIQTNHWSSESIGKIIIKRNSKSVTLNQHSGQDRHSLVARLAGGNRSINTSESEQLDYDVQPRAFTGLKRGGPANKFLVEAILTKAGESFAFSQQRWLRIAFDQRVPGRSLFHWLHSTPKAYITAPRKETHVGFQRPGNATAHQPRREELAESPSTH